MPLSPQARHQSQHLPSKPTNSIDNCWKLKPHKIIVKDATQVMPYVCENFKIKTITFEPSMLLIFGIFFLHGNLGRGPGQCKRQSWSQCTRSKKLLSQHNATASIYVLLDSKAAVPIPDRQPDNKDTTDEWTLGNHWSAQLGNWHALWVLNMGLSDILKGWISIHELAMFNIRAIRYC